MRRKDAGHLGEQEPPPPKEHPFKLVERLTPYLERTITISEILHWEKTNRGQEIVVADTLQFGRTLIVDGIMQFCTYDEHFYHEALAHPALTTHPSPASVLILGGGDGMLARECLKHDPVERLLLVDFDEKIMTLSKRFFPGVEEVFKDQRVEVVLADALEYIDEGSRCNVLLVDVTDEEDPHSARLFRKEFYVKASKIVGRDGIVGIQMGCPPLVDSTTFMKQTSALSEVFRRVSPYMTYVPSFGSAWGFATASQRYSLQDLDEREVDERLMERSVSNRFYDGALHAYFSKMRTEVS